MFEQPDTSYTKDYLKGAFVTRELWKTQKEVCLNINVFFFLTFSKLNSYLKLKGKLWYERITWHWSNFTGK